MVVIVFFAGCYGGLQDIDRRAESYMAETSGSFGENHPSVQLNPIEPSTASLIDTSPTTVNPPVEKLGFLPAGDLDKEKIAADLDRAADVHSEQSELLSLNKALSWANKHAREMKFAEYDYLSSTLSLLSELHLWGPRFYNTVSTDLTAESDGGLYDTSLDVVNDFSISHKLANGGSVSANALTSFARDLHSTTIANSASSTLSVSMEIPLLKNSGAVARETLIQSKRDMVYAARTFERFRRSFCATIIGDYLSLVVQKQSLKNAQRGVDSLKQLAKRQSALYESGRSRLYNSADAENQALAAVARLSQSWESFRLALDRFKIRIGWPIDSQIQVEATSLGLFPPDVSVSNAVIDALQFRMDLQNERDRVVDTRRGIKNALNALLPDVSLTASASTDSQIDKPVKFGGEEIDYLAGISISLPLDTEVERIAVRQQQIALEKANRNYRESRDGVAVEVRSALRNIELYQFTLDLQERNVSIAQLGLDSINADPDRVSVLDQTRAISDLQSARDARDGAIKDLELSIIDYLLQAGRLRIGVNGELLITVSETE